MTWITMVFGLACLVCGMACVLLAFMAFKPVLMDYYMTLAAETRRQTVAIQQQARTQRAFVEAEEPKGKSDRHGVVRPKNPNSEDVI